MNVVANPPHVQVPPTATSQVSASGGVAPYSPSVSSKPAGVTVTIHGANPGSGPWDVEISGGGTGVVTISVLDNNGQLKSVDIQVN